MLLTLSASCLRSLLLPSGRAKRPKMALGEVPQFTRESLGLSGVNLSTDLLAGADRSVLEHIRERADKASCACLLLVEADTQKFGAVDDAVGKAAAARMTRVVEAAQILGCSSAALRIEAEDSEPALARVALRLKSVVERAEKLDVNLLIAPHKGLTATPERLADLIKKVGGFRIGTFPDFEAAAAQKDPTSYLRRLTPYASVVSASTRKFSEPRQITKSKPKAGVKKAVDPEEVLDDADEGPELPEDILAELAAEFGPDGKGETAPAEPEVLLIAEHESYPLKPLIAAVASVGYDGTLAVDYRGEGDVVQGITYSRNALQHALNEVMEEG